MLDLDDDKNELDFVFNEQKVRDAEVTMFQLEQKIMKLESMMLNT